MIADIVGVDGVIVLVLLALYLVGFAALVDSVRQPDRAYVAAGQSKAMWVVLNAVGLLFCGVVPIAYLIAVRPSIVRAQRATGPGGASGGSA